MDNVFVIAMIFAFFSVARGSNIASLVESASFARQVNCEGKCSLIDYAAAMP
jgi:hypothetical protein